MSLSVLGKSNSFTMFFGRSKPCVVWTVSETLVFAKETCPASRFSRELFVLALIQTGMVD